MVLSIALGVFLIVTIGSLAESARVLRVNDMRQNTGVNHVFYTGLNNNQIDKIKAHDNVKAAANCFNYDLWKSADRWQGSTLHE
jgi:putative ABC transport system permease protein